MLSWLKGLGAIGAVVIAFFAVVIVGLAITIAVAKLDAGASKPLGDAQKQQQINSGANQLEAQADIKSKKEAIGRYESQIAADKQTIASNPGNAFDQNTLTTDESGCRNAVADYNKAVIDDQEAPYLPTGFPTAFPFTACQ